MKKQEIQEKLKRLKQRGDLVQRSEQDRFAELTVSPRMWIKKADALKHAADHIRRIDLADDGDIYSPVQPTFPVGINVEVKRHYHSMLRVYFLLSGLAIEGYAKGIVLSRGKQRVQYGALERWEASGHGILQIVELAKLKVTPDEKQTLSRLGDYVLWKGRYPTPLKSTDYENLAGGRGAPLFNNGRGDIDCIEALCIRLKAKLQRLSGARARRNAS